MFGWFRGAFDKQMAAGDAALASGDLGGAGQAYQAALKAANGNAPKSGMAIAAFGDVMAGVGNQREAMLMWARGVTMMHGTRGPRLEKAYRSLAAAVELDASSPE